MKFTSFDHDMAALAKYRGRVVVTTRDGRRQTTATLIAWRPRAMRNTARVQFDTGGTASVPLHQVSLPEVKT